MQLPWFAIRVRSNCEAIVSTSLRCGGHEEFLPKYVHRRWYAGGFRDVQRPLFPGYVFARVDLGRRIRVLTIPGVVDILGNRKIPIPIEEAEMAALQRMVDSGLAIQPWPFLKAGDRVLLETGPLTGLEGTLVALKKDYRLIVSITLLQRSVAVEIDRNWVRPLTQSATFRPQTAVSRCCACTTCDNRS